MNLKFWKKKDDLGLPGGNDLGLGGMPSDDPGFGQPPGMDMPSESPMPDSLTPSSQGFGHQATPNLSHHQENPQFQQAMPVQEKDGRETELILAKLDSIKSELDSINQRLMRLERIAESSGSDVPQPSKRYARIY